MLKVYVEKLLSYRTKIKVYEPGAKNHRRKPTVGRTKSSTIDRGISFPTMTKNVFLHIMIGQKVIFS